MPQGSPVVWVGTELTERLGGSLSRCKCIMMCFVACMAPSRCYYVKPTVWRHVSTPPAQQAPDTTERQNMCCVHCQRPAARRLKSKPKLAPQVSHSPSSLPAEPKTGKPPTGATSRSSSSGLFQLPELMSHRRWGHALSCCSPLMKL